MIRAVEERCARRGPITAESGRVAVGFAAKLMALLMGGGCGDADGSDGWWRGGGAGETCVRKCNSLDGALLCVSVCLTTSQHNIKIKHFSKSVTSCTFSVPF